MKVHRRGIPSQDLPFRESPGDGESSYIGERRVGGLPGISSVAGEGESQEVLYCFTISDLLLRSRDPLPYARSPLSKADHLPSHVEMQVSHPPRGNGCSKGHTQLWRGMGECMAVWERPCGMWHLPWRRSSGRCWLWTWRTFP